MAHSALGDKKTHTFLSAIAVLPVRYITLTPVSDRPGGGVHLTLSQCDPVYVLLDVDARNYRLTNTNCNLTL